MTLQAKLDASKADFEAGKPPYNVPPAVIETMHPGAGLNDGGQHRHPREQPTVERHC